MILSASERNRAISTELVISIVLSDNPNYQICIIYARIQGVARPLRLVNGVGAGVERKKYMERHMKTSVTETAKADWPAASTRCCGNCKHWHVREYIHCQCSGPWGGDIQGDQDCTFEPITPRQAMARRMSR